MLSTLLWPFVVLLLGALLVWCGEKLLRAWLKIDTANHKLGLAEREQELRVKAHQANLDEQTLTAQVKLRNAELANLAAEEAAAQHATEALREERIAAERKVLKAVTEARCARASKTAAEIDVPVPSGKELLDAYERFLRLTENQLSFDSSFGKFVDDYRRGAGF